MNRENSQGTEADLRAGPYLYGKTVVIYLPDLSGGGAERLHINLATEFLKAGLRVVFLLNQSKGPLLSQVPEGCEIVTLNATRLLKAFPKLVQFLKMREPDYFISNMEHTNIMSVWARKLAGVRSKIIATQHISLLKQSERKSWQFKIILLLYKMYLKHVDAVVCVSSGVAQELIKSCSLKKELTHIIYNGLVSEGVDDRFGELSNHPAFTNGTHTVLAIGRLVAQKDHASLIEALAFVRHHCDATLIILGDGPLKGELLELARVKGVESFVHFPGFVSDPRPFIRRADLVVLSSAFEGFGNVLVEAMACGKQVVSTNCPYGPDEILELGRFGRLVPVRDPGAMSEAVVATLSSRNDDDVTSLLRSRAMDFSIERCGAAYCSLLRSI